MDYDKLTDTLRQHGVSCVRAHGRYCSICDEAATALSTLQAENKKLRETVDKYATSARAIALHLKPFCDESLPYDEMIADAARKASDELEQVKRERDAAIGDIEEILAEIEQIRTSVEEPDVGEDWALSAICQKYCDRGGDHCWKDSGLGRCGNFRWKKPEKDESTCHDGVCDIPGVIVQDEATEFTRGQWDWLMGRFTRKED